MDQTVPKAAVERFKAAVDEKPNAPVMRKSTLVPENANPDVSEKLAAIKAALSQKNENQDVNAQKAVEPVSYTHLDVYKRQCQSRGRWS